MEYRTDFKVTIPTAEGFTPDNKSLGFLDEYQFNELRIHCYRNKIKGYYFMFEGIKIDISDEGRLYKEPPVGFFGLIDKQLWALL